MKKRILTLVFVCACLLVLLSLLCICSAIHSAHTLIVTQYEIAAPLKAPLRIVQLSDLHNASFGEDNRDLVKKVSDLEPDLIFLTGDMLNSNERDIGVLTGLLRKLVKIAPVYVSYGNHETSWEADYEKTLREPIEDTGAVVLELEYLDLEIKGDAFRLGGFSGYYRAPVMTTHDPEQRARELQFADNFENTARYKILLSHIPTPWLDWEYRDEYNVDLVFCGHYHGGLVRLPLIGGLYAPNIGLFPKYTKGLYNDEGAAVVLSAGLSSNRKLPRINNPGEIVCIDLIPEK